MSKRRPQASDLGWREDTRGDVRHIFRDGVDKVLELVGTTTLLDSLQSAARFGSVCMTGMVGNTWEFDRFSPMGAIPSTFNLTTYAGESQDLMATPLHGRKRSRWKDCRSHLKQGTVDKQLASGAATGCAALYSNLNEFGCRLNALQR